MSGVLLAAVGNSYGYKPINTVAPAITGTAQARVTLTCSTGTWDAAPLPITYSYQWQKNGSNISGATNNTYVVLSADVGSTLRCVVTASNAVGATSANSNTTATVIANVPAAPTIGTATATGSSTATVAFTPPADNGGATITSYTAVSSPGGLTATGSSSPLTVTGLTPSTSYTFVVRATNSVGNSANSASSNSITTQEAYWIAVTDDYGPGRANLVTIGGSVAVAGPRSTNNVFRIYTLNAAGSLGSVILNRGGGYNSGGGFGNDSQYVAIGDGSNTWLGSTQRKDTPRGGVVYGVNSSGSAITNAGIISTVNRNFDSGVLARDSNGSFYLGGSSYYQGVNETTVTKFNSSGTIQWCKVLYSGQNTNLPNSIAATTSIVAYAAQRSSWTAPIGLNASTGALAWGTQGMQISGYSGGTGTASVVIDSSSNSYFLISGQWGGAGGQGIVKYNSSGTQQWGVYNNNMTGTSSLTLAADGFIYWTAQRYIAPYNRLYIVKINTSGTVQWTRQLYRSDGDISGSQKAATIGSTLYIPFTNSTTVGVLKVPTDGSRTGTYGNYTYADAGLGFGSGSLSVYNSAATIQNQTEYTTTSQSPSDFAYTPSITVTNM